ncbi:hypothetical protein ACJMK2_044211 [Sinanodonta woodiana]|uniref:Uncharacterized protein n=1 Tax=Sinanodonta woodiana TaxID=1069815 RepID=A0ABD3W2P2_SINWO
MTCVLQKLKPYYRVFCTGVLHRVSCTGVLHRVFCTGCHAQRVLHRAICTGCSVHRILNRVYCTVRSAQGVLHRVSGPAHGVLQIVSCTGCSFIAYLVRDNSDSTF